MNSWTVYKQHTCENRIHFCFSFFLLLLSLSLVYLDSKSFVAYTHCVAFHFIHFLSFTSSLNFSPFLPFVLVVFAISSCTSSFGICLFYHDSFVLYSCLFFFCLFVFRFGFFVPWLINSYCNRIHNVICNLHFSYHKICQKHFLFIKVVLPYIALYLYDSFSIFLDCLDWNQSYILFLPTCYMDTSELN